MLHAGDGSRLDGTAHADLLAEALHGKDGGVGRHADGQHDAGDTRQRQAEQVEGGKGRQDAEVEHGEHGHGRGGDDTEALVEEQQVQHDESQADEGHDDAGGERVLAEGGADDLGLGVLEGHRQRAGLQDGLQRLGVFQRVLAGDGHFAVGDLGLHGRGGLHLAVQDDDDLAVVGHQIARGVGEGLGALGVQRDVHAVVGAALALAADGDVGDVGAGDDGRVGARLHGHVLHLARGEGVAELVGHRTLAGSLAGIDGALHVLVGERVQTGELQRAGAPDGGERLFRIGQAGDLHENLVASLLLHRGLRGAQRVHAALDDGAGLLHVLGGDRRTVRGLRREHHRQAALDVQALVDLLVGRGEQHHRHDDEQGGEDEQPHVAAIRRTGRLLLDVAFQCHGMRPSSFAFRSPARPGSLSALPFFSRAVVLLAR